VDSIVSCDNDESKLEVMDIVHKDDSIVPQTLLLFCSYLAKHNSSSYSYLAAH